MREEMSGGVHAGRLRDTARHPSITRGLRKMKSTSLPHGAGFMFVILASASSSIGIVGSSAAEGAEVTAPQMIEAFEGDFGVHPGQRRNHAKGLCAAGEFVG